MHANGQGTPADSALHYRAISHDSLKVRAAEPAEDGVERAVIEGYACVWDVLDTFGTLFAPGTFDQTLTRSADRVRVMHVVEHTPETPLGPPDELRDDGRGLWFSTTVRLDTQKVRDAVADIRARRRGGMSVGFDEPVVTDPADPRRIISARLTEISSVAIPSVPGSAAIVRSAGRPALDAVDAVALDMNYTDEERAAARLTGDLLRGKRSAAPAVSASNAAAPDPAAPTTTVEAEASTDTTPDEPPPLVLGDAFRRQLSDELAHTLAAQARAELDARAIVAAVRDALTTGA